MVNSEMIRVNELQNITSRGFIVKLHAVEKSVSVWPEILRQLEVELKSAIEDDILASEVKLLQFNNSNRGSFQIPVCGQFPNLSSVMQFCVEFCLKISKDHNNKVSYFAGKMNLEQAFLAYASHQIDKDRPAE